MRTDSGEMRCWRYIIWLEVCFKYCVLHPNMVVVVRYALHWLALLSAGLPLRW